MKLKESLGNNIGMIGDIATDAMSEIRKLRSKVQQRDQKSLDKIIGSLAKIRILSKG